MNWQSYFSIISWYIGWCKSPAKIALFAFSSYFSKNSFFTSADISNRGFPREKIQPSATKDIIDEVCDLFCDKLEVMFCVGGGWLQRWTDFYPIAGWVGLNLGSFCFDALNLSISSLSTDRHCPENQGKFESENYERSTDLSVQQNGCNH